MTILQKKSRVDYSRALPRAVPTKGSPKKVNRVRKFKSALQKQMTKAVEREQSGKENKSIKISGAVEEVIHREVEQLLDGRRAKNLPCTLEDVVNTKNLPCTLEDVVNTICEGDGKHTFADESPFGKKKGGILRGIILELKRSFKMMRRFHFVNAFRAFLERDDTNATSIGSWEQAKHIFSSKIIFLQNDVAPKRIDTADTNNVATLSEGMKGLSVVPFNHDKDDHEVSKYEAVLREIATASIPKKIRQPAGEVDDPSREETARLQALHLEKKKSKVVEAVQHRMSEKEKEKEAKKLAESLLRELTSEEEAAVNKAMYGGGPDNEVLYSLGPDSVQRASLHRLQLGEWLNDEVISYFYVMLAKRDEELCSQDPSRKRSHFFKSFFMTKLLNEGHTDLEGTYDYRQVKRWSKKGKENVFCAIISVIYHLCTQ